MKYLDNPFINSQTDVFFCIANFDGFFIELNQVWSKKLGWSDEELKSRPYIDFIHPDDVASTIRQTTDLINGKIKSINAYEHRIACKDGNYLWLSWNALPDNEKKIFYASAIDNSTNIIRSKKVEQFKIGVDQIAIISQTDTKGIITEVNSKFCEISGYADDELIGQNHRIVNSFFHPKEFFKDLWDTINSGKVWKGDVCNRKKNGELYWVNSEIIPLKNDHGEITGHLSIRFEITDRKKLETTLMETSNRLGTLLDSSPLSILTVDTNGTIATFNRTAEKVFGHNKMDVLGKNFTSVLCDNAGIEVFTNKATSLGQYVDEWTCVKKDGNRFPVKIYVTPLVSQSGEKIGFVKMIEDLTEIKETHKLINDQRLQIINSEKMSSLGEMASGIAHEINNPLAIIQANASLMENLLIKSDVPKKEILETLSTINITTERIAKIIRGVRSIYRDAGEDAFEAVSVNKIVEDILNISEQKLKKAAIKFSYKIPTEEILIDCSAVQISQVLINLINNSFDSIKDFNDKWISLEFKLIDDSRSIEISVTDSGAGIPQHIADKILQPFFTTKSAGGGAGIGLSISRGIIEQHHGLLYLDRTSPNTRFAFIIPLKNKR